MVTFGSKVATRPLAPGFIPLVPPPQTGACCAAELGIFIHLAPDFTYIAFPMRTLSMVVAPDLVSVRILSGQEMSMLISVAPDFIVICQLVALAIAELMAAPVTAILTLLTGFAVDDSGVLALSHPRTIPSPSTKQNPRPDCVSLRRISDLL